MRLHPLQSSMVPADLDHLRGGRARGTKTLTSALHGLVRDDASTRQELLALTGPGR